MLLGRVAKFRVDDAIPREVHHRLGGDAAKVRLCLHHGRGVSESLEIAHEVSGVGVLREDALELVGVGGRQLVPNLGSEFDDGRGAQAAVEVIVQQHLGQGENLGIGEGHETRLTPAAPRAAHARNVTEALATRAT